MISLVLYQSPYFMALFRSAPWWPYKFWKMRSWSLSPPYVRFGASCTVARFLLCDRDGVAVERREAAHVAGNARWTTALSTCGAGAWRTSIVSTISGCSRAIAALGACWGRWSGEASSGRGPLSRAPRVCVGHPKPRAVIGSGKVVDVKQWPRRRQQHASSRQHDKYFFTVPSRRPHQVLW